MLLLVSRTFLVLLLVLDWAADPNRLAPAVRAWASPWCCTENVCPSNGYQRIVLQECVPPLLPHGPAGTVDDWSPPALWQPAEGPPLLTSLSTDLVYRFMTLRR
jgi:hypothetical protein